MKRSSPASFEKKEWDAKGGFTIEVRDPNTSGGLVVFGYDIDEDWEALNDEDKYDKDEKIEPSLHEDEDPQEHDEDENRALVRYEDSKTRDEERKLLEGCRCEDPMYAKVSPTAVLLSSYKEAFRGQTTRRVKKKEEMCGCIMSMEDLQLKT
jgi:hypothetical protein